MRARLLASAIFLIPMAAKAKVEILSQTGDWAVVADEEKGHCAMSSVGDRSLMIRKTEGEQAYAFIVTNPKWRLPEGQKVAVGLEVGEWKFESKSTAGSRTAVISYTPQADSMFIIAMIAKESNLTLRFPEGTEPPWTISLRGSSVAATKFYECIQPPQPYGRSR
ncbi:hypothetical protein ACFOD4_04545 [Pseudoroseomonas globiformis]|uniref:Uncharacterized protein n=1 Tax=Teichococcus globiformis TaxID=2307229 RepID=A0ABV7FY23_9PROT